jgi:hypothetical protein
VSAGWRVGLYSDLVPLFEDLFPVPLISSDGRAPSSAVLAEGPPADSVRFPSRLRALREALALTSVIEADCAAAVSLERAVEARRESTIRDMTWSTTGDDDGEEDAEVLDGTRTGSGFCVLS